MVARLDPMKDHDTFLKAFALLAADQKQVRAVFVGNGLDSIRQTLQMEATKLAIADRLVWVSERPDMPAVYNALDLLCLPSAFGEGFPNAVAEAMACEVPCVVTDVGDAAQIVGDLGRVVPPQNPEALSKALQTVAQLPLSDRRALGRSARRRIVENFSVKRLVEGTLSAFNASRNSGPQ